MAKVMPSQVVQAIDNLFSNSRPGDANNIFTVDHSAMLAGLVELIDAVPDELFATCSSQDYTDLVQGRANIRAMQPVWAAGHHRNLSPILGKDIVKVFRRVMEALPDDYPPADDNSLAFILDLDLRDSIRRDVGAAHQALANSEWKPATVMAGAAIEAHLHWRLSDPSTRPKAQAANAARRAAFDEWGLAVMIDVAEELTILDRTTATAARLSKDYRNLIHPGRAVRTGLKCTRGTAHSAVGGMDGVIEALS